MGAGCAASVFRRVLHDLGDQPFGTGLAVHVGHQVAELRPGFQQFFERFDLGGDRGGRKIVHALEGDIDRQVAFAGQRVGHGKRGTRRHGLHPVVEIVHVDFKKLAIRDRRLLDFGLAGKIAHHTHHEGQLHFLFGAV